MTIGSLNFSFALACLFFPGIAASNAEEPLKIHPLEVPDKFISSFDREYEWHLKGSGGSGHHVWSISGLGPDGGLYGDRIIFKAFGSYYTELQITLTDARNTDNSVSVYYPIQVIQRVTVTGPYTRGDKLWSLDFVGTDSSSSPPMIVLADTYPSGEPLHTTSADESGSSLKWLTIDPVKTLSPARINVGIDFQETGSRYSASGRLQVSGGGESAFVDVVWHSVYISPIILRPGAKTINSPSMETKHLELRAAAGRSEATGTIHFTPVANQTAYAILGDRDWLSFNPNTGLINSMIQINVTARAAGLSPGLHSGRLAIYDQTGVIVSEILVQFRIYKHYAPIELDTKHISFTSVKQRQTLKLKNPNARSIPFILRSDDQSLRLNPESGQIPPYSERTIDIESAASASIAPRTTANIVLSFDNAQLELVTASRAPMDVDPQVTDALVIPLQPGAHFNTVEGGATSLRIQVQDNFGNLIRSGTLTVQAPSGIASPMALSPDGSWLGTWKASDKAEGAVHLKFIWTDPVTNKGASAWSQATFKR